ncbi:MAG: hypothetical protein U0893_14195 [Chloroflexota bacterium]
MARRLFRIRPASRSSIRSLQLLSVLLMLLTTACGGVLNPPPPPTVPPPTVPRPTFTPEPTATPTPERWVKNHRVTDMWSGPASDRNAISFGKTSSAFCIFRIDEEIDDARVFVYNPHLDGRFWIDASAIGPVEPPAHRAGPKPEGVNCSDALYDGAAASTTPRAATTGTALTPAALVGASATSAATAQTTPSPATTVTPIAEMKTGQPLVLALYYPWYGAGQGH